MWDGLSHDGRHDGSDGQKWMWRKPHLGDGGVSGSHVGGTVELVLMGDLHPSGPLVQEAAGRVESAVSHTRLLLKVFTHTVAVVEVTHAGLICAQREKGG